MEVAYCTSQCPGERDMGSYGWKDGGYLSTAFRAVEGTTRSLSMNQRRGPSFFFKKWAGVPPPTRSQPHYKRRASFEDPL
jgi:hypothetical protein